MDCSFDSPCFVCSVGFDTRATPDSLKTGVSQLIGSQTENKYVCSCCCSTNAFRQYLLHNISAVYSSGDHIDEVGDSDDDGTDDDDTNGASVLLLFSILCNTDPSLLLLLFGLPHLILLVVVASARILLFSHYFCKQKRSDIVEKSINQSINQICK
jgi:hypothetical protein